MSARAMKSYRAESPANGAAMPRYNPLNYVHIVITISFFISGPTPSFSTIFLAQSTIPCPITFTHSTAHFKLVFLVRRLLPRYHLASNSAHGGVCICRQLTCMVWIRTLIVSRGCPTRTCSYIRTSWARQTLSTKQMPPTPPARKECKYPTCFCSSDICSLHVKHY